MMMAGANGSSEEVGSLWIDFLLLPSKLEEHLAALAGGTVTSPSCIELISMFLEQAVVSHKTNCNTYGNKDMDAPYAISNLVGKTATVLCEQAAKLAVSFELTLADIESIPSQQHQFLLLKALIKHDKLNSLVHQCDLHRWLVHNVLKWKQSGFSSLKTSCTSASLSFYALGDDSRLVAGAQPDDKMASVNVADGFGEKNDSIKFLENTLGCLEAVSQVESGDQMAVQNSEIWGAGFDDDVSGTGLAMSPSVSEVYKCQIMLDIAEVHFMSGRIWKAHDMFTTCGQLSVKIACSGNVRCENVQSVSLELGSGNSHNALPVPRDRLAGFIIACRMILGMHLIDSHDKKKASIFPIVDIKKPPLLYLDSPSTNYAIIACEQMRWLVRRGAFSVLLPVNTSACASFLNPAQKRQKVEDPDGSGHRVSQLNYGLNVEDCEDLCSFTDGISLFLKKYSVAVDLEHLHGQDLAEDKTEKLGSASLSTNNLILEGQQMAPSELIAQKCLVNVFVRDLLKGDLTWGYRLSLEKDFSLSLSTRCQVIACNTVQNILLGASFESFLRISEHLDGNVEGVEFLLKLIATTVKRLKGNVQTEVNEVNRSDLLCQTAFHTGRKRGIDEVDATDKEVLLSRLYQFVRYILCVLDKSWCWSIAQDLSFLSDTDIRTSSGSALGVNVDPIVGVEQISFTTAGMNCSPSSASQNFLGKANFVALFELMQAEKLYEYEALCQNQAAALGKSTSQEVTPLMCKADDVQLGDGQLLFPQSHLDSEKDVQCKCKAFVLRRKAFDALKHGKKYKLAVYLYDQAKLLDSEDNECNLMLWLLKKLTKKQGEQMEGNGLDSTGKKTLKSLPSLELLNFTLQKLIDEELWTELSELCKWLASSINESLIVHDGSFKAGKINEKARKATWLLKLATVLGKLITFCFSSKPNMASNSFAQDISDLATPMWQLFEDFLSHLFDADGMLSRDVSTSQTQGFHKKSLIHSSLHASANAISLISKISNPKVMMCLAALTAGWLQRCHMARLTPWLLDVERYGILASVMAGVPLPSTVGPSSASIYRKFSLCVSPDVARDLFRMLLKRIVDLPNVVDLDTEKGHCWLQGLGDLAFEDDDHIRALQYYLQAGAIRSAYYCHCRSSMQRDIFTPWIIMRMIRACRAIGAGLQGAVLCQCLPNTDYDLASRILQESLVIMDQDMQLYSECIWEVPILELLIHMHSKAGDEARVSLLISLLQQPALNAHNPSSVRKAHIEAMEQRFLQRFYEEIM